VNIKVSSPLDEINKRASPPFERARDTAAAKPKEKKNKQSLVFKNNRNQSKEPQFNNENPLLNAQKNLKQSLKEADAQRAKPTPRGRN